MIRRRFLQLLAGGVIGTAATLHLPGSLLAKTAIGRRSALEYIRRAYLEHCATHRAPPQLLVAERDLYDAFGDELQANERFVAKLSLREQYEALAPEHMLFKGSRIVPSPRRGWALQCW